jgi:uncharacterized RDD family membrane protein YckC
VLAHRSTRLGAAILDGLLVGLVMLPPFVIAFHYAGILSGTPKPWVIQALTGHMSYALQLGIAAFSFLMFLAVQGWPLARYGQTWAKRWLGIRIVDLDGRKPEFVRLVVMRYGVGQLVGLVPCLGMVYALTDSLFIFRDDRRCVHDLLAGTRVVFAEPPPPDRP